MDVSLFWLAALVVIGSATMVVLHRHPVYSALSLIVTFCGLGFIFLLLGAQFLAMAQVIVYAGAIMVLFLFVIMLLNLDRPLETEPVIRSQRPLGMLATVLLLVELAAVIVKGSPAEFRQAPVPPPESFGLTHAVAAKLFSDYAFAFEVTSIVLLVAMVGVIVLAKRLRQQELAESEQRHVVLTSGGASTPEAAAVGE